MKDEIKQIIQLISENKTLNEISTATGLSNRQLFTKLSMLRHSGFLVDKKYYYNGDISYYLANPFVTDINSNNEVTLNIPEDIKKIRILLTSDTHLGDKNDNLACIDKMTDYCIKEGIHNIINAGDFLAGIYPNNKNIAITDAFAQVQYGLQNYPYDKNILTFVCLGNHDASFWLENGIDIKTILLDRRHDIIPLGYASGIINISGNKIVVQHPIERVNNIHILSVPNSLVIKGHSHKFKTIMSGHNVTVYVPTMSNVNTQLQQSMIPSMIDMELTITEQGIQHEYFQQFIFINNEFIRVAEVAYNIPIPTKKTDKEEIIDDLKPRTMNFYTKAENKPLEELTETEELATANNVPELPETTVKTFIPQNNYKGMNQIEKFNARYGVSNPNKKVLKK